MPTRVNAVRACSPVSSRLPCAPDTTILRIWYLYASVRVHLDWQPDQVSIAPFLKGRSHDLNYELLSTHQTLDSFNSVQRVQTCQFDKKGDASFCVVGFLYPLRHRNTVLIGPTPSPTGNSLVNRR